MPPPRHGWWPARADGGDWYDRILRDRLEAVFRAYVDDATGRRGCTGVVLPAPADFAGS
ncbi:hypothetical protein AB0M10_27315 [Streptomyces sp. NPDC051840]|uniref:hypothetical protein n=1 Tax=Streptomyces sp. NPDC051840 TaxID=3154752 RepID=UPI0034157EDE